MAQCLAEFEEGDVNGWWHLCLQLTLDPEGLSHATELESDLTTLPGWRAADERTRQRILQCAAAYLRNGEPDTKSWLGTGNIHRPALAGYKALCLLQREAPSLFLGLESGVWARWAAVLVTYYFPSEKEDNPVWRELVRIALDRAPEALVQTLGSLIEHEAKNPREVSWLRIYLPKLSDCFDNELFKRLMLELAQDQVALPQHVTTILQELLERRFRAAFEFGCGLIEVPVPIDRLERERSIAAAEALILSGNPEAWPHLWNAFRTDEDFANEALKAAANSAFVLRYTAIFAALDERSLAELFVWLEKRYPHKIGRDEEEFSEAGHVIGPLDRVAQFRDAALMTLRGRGTLAAVIEMKRVRDQFPDLDFLQIAALDTEKLALARTWKGPKPKEFLELIRKSDARFVANADELLAVVCESLQRLEKEEFQNETSTAPGFWDKTTSGRFRPKDEPTIANEIARHLDRDLKRRGIIVNREVEVHRPLGPSKGPATDIHIDTTIQGSDTDDADRLKVVIEVKGSWNAEVKTAMKDQLLGKYLLTPDCSRGIYLVAWFDRELWDPTDNRRRTVPAWTKETAKEFLNEQAVTLSDSDRVVRAVVLDCNPVVRKTPKSKRKESPIAKKASRARNSKSSSR